MLYCTVLFCVVMCPVVLHFAAIFLIIYLITEVTE